MLDIHITEFYNDTGRILATLYAQFPRLNTLWVSDICGPDTPDEFGLQSPRYLACYATVLWLQEEGYLRYSEIDRHDAINNCCLTEKGYLALAGIAELSEGAERPIDQLRAGIKDASSIAIEKAVQRVLVRDYVKSSKLQMRDSKNQ